MATKITIRGGILKSVYDDRFMPLLKLLGEPVITRASEIEFNGKEWEARYLETGEVIARGENRSEVINQEVNWIEEKLCHTPSK